MRSHSSCRFHDPSTSPMQAGCSSRAPKASIPQARPPTQRSAGTSTAINRSHHSPIHASRPTASSGSSWANVGEGSSAGTPPWRETAATVPASRDGSNPPSGPSSARTPATNVRPPSAAPTVATTSARVLASIRSPAPGPPERNGVRPASIVRPSRWANPSQSGSPDGRYGSRTGARPAGRRPGQSRSNGGSSSIATAGDPTLRRPARRPGSGRSGHGVPVSHGGGVLDDLRRHLVVAGRAARRSRRRSTWRPPRAPGARR